ncbi:MAG: DUF1670 domain-containing protein [Bacteroidales bacterium]|nr:DUF1670 domain-containing protein [Bacteroidales bacterium]MDP3003220.1 DUF1670 domain-containing protein [Bacteroidales bacterium]
MLRQPDEYHRYHSAHDRFIKPIIEDFFSREFPNTFGPNTRSNIADELLAIFKSNNRETQTIKPGQILWNAVHKYTRADSPNRKLVPVVLTIVADEDISNLEKRMSISENRQNIISRITQEAYSQGALLSMRDISLLLASHLPNISLNRKKYEEKHSCSLPHTGTLHDMGSCITHKYQIVYKYIIEKKDPLIIAKETNHSLKAVDHYLKDYNRVKLLYMENKPPEYIKLATALSVYVINQYIDIINQYVKELNAS